MTRIPKIKQLQTTAAGTITINWDLVEQIIGFQLHDNLKNFYSRILGSKNKYGTISGQIKFNPVGFVKRYVNREDWLVNANNTSHAELSLDLLTETDVAYVVDYLQEAFKGAWTGGNDFGNRAYIGDILINMGQITLVFNNDTGKFEWVDFGYGYFEVYEENPYGIVADHTQEFLDKFMLVKKC
ncbi:MAG: hypothetical protein OSJ73_15860 [Lachnospiraceae bacterium]|jgi:hypothetical protein|nr:hypothetical protein [Lachnospiraceae bacterium]